MEIQNIYLHTVPQIIFVAENEEDKKLLNEFAKGEDNK